MITKVTKPVRRKVPSKHYGEVILSIYPEGTIGIRRKYHKHEDIVSVDGVIYLAAKATAMCDMTNGTGPKATRKVKRGIRL